MRSYPYRPLQYDDSIRVLILHPSTKSSDPILGSIQHTRLSDEAFGYEALSYTWGDTTEKEAIYLQNGRRELLVGKNCHDALLRLRREDSDRMLWIDAICINQEDLPERTRQVRVMGAVYDRAFNVVVYLGEQTAESRALFQELEVTDEHLRHQGVKGLSRPSDVIGQQIDTLLERPWFKRVWVLQEVCAKSSVILMCGSTAISPEALSALSFRHSLTTPLIHGQEVWPVALGWIDNPPILFASPQFNLWNRMYHSRRCLASDPRDKVFALRSLIGPERLQMNYIINYTQSTEECYIQVTIFLLLKLGLRPLTAARHPHEMDMPSWIPDWSQNLPLDAVFFNHDNCNGTLTHNMMRPGTPTEQNNTTWSFSYSGSKTNPELYLTGCFYAQIIESGRAFHFDSLNDAGMQLNLFNRSYLNRSRRKGSTTDDEAFPYGFGRRTFDIMSMMNDLHVYMHLCRQEGTWEISEEGFVAVYKTNYGPFYNALQQCRISLMDNGELVTVPEAVRVGDAIVMFSGADSPCAIRPDECGGWTLISGDCYNFTEQSLSHWSGHFWCNEYVESNQSKVEEFILR